MLSDDDFETLGERLNFPTPEKIVSDLKAMVGEAMTVAADSLKGDDNESADRYMRGVEQLALIGTALRAMDAPELAIVGPNEPPAWQPELHRVMFSYADAHPDNPALLQVLDEFSPSRPVAFLHLLSSIVEGQCKVPTEELPYVVTSRNFSFLEINDT